MEFLRKWKSRGGCNAWCRKYFWEGQLRSHEVLMQDPEQHRPMSLARRKLLAFLVPMLTFHFFFWSYMIRNNMFRVFKDKYYMSLVMLFGGFVAGATSEAGGAVAFPVMTLVFGVSPIVARDVAIGLQACGMSCASLTILFMQIQFERNAYVFCTLGGVAGSVFGHHVVEPALSPAQKKMYFVSIWFSFAFALFILNWQRKRPVFFNIPNCGWPHRLVLMGIGFFGGICTSFAGSGLDICCFSFLTLLFRVSEKVATPTSVLLMATNSIVNVLWRWLVLGGMPNEAWEFLLVITPVVTIQAPVGSFLGTHFHRLVLAAFVYVIDTAALIGAFAIVPQTKSLIGASCGIIIFGGIFFVIITKIGTYLLHKREETQLVDMEEEKSVAPDEKPALLEKEQLQNGHEASEVTEEEKDYTESTENCVIGSV